MGSRFKDLSPPLSKNVLKVVNSLGFTSMTPVQAAVIPLFLGNKDVAAEVRKKLCSVSCQRIPFKLTVRLQACTGSGKTLAFVIPIIERLQALDKKLIKTQVGAIVISPTRELARQTFGVIKKFTAVIPDLHPILLVGGSDTTADMYKCAEHGCNIMVATPGRLLDVLNRASLSDDISFKSLEVLGM
jgi:ATP-dependent RNA helicase DDX55/SPB4